MENRLEEAAAIRVQAWIHVRAVGEVELRQGFAHRVRGETKLEPVGGEGLDSYKLDAVVGEKKNGEREVGASKIFIYHSRRRAKKSTVAGP